MKENIDKAIEWVKKQPIQGCITGSCLLDYFEGQDVDIFTYNEKSFIKILFAMYHSDDFDILDPLEKWKFEQYIDKSYDNFQKFGLITIKFTYNTCVEVNVVLKKKCFDIFSVLASFDMDIICKGYDVETKQTLDLSVNGDTKVATWNRWNTAFYSTEIWALSRILRQIERCFKYHKRGYNVDKVMLKFIELINEIQKFDNIFTSENFTESLKLKKENTKIIKKVCETWLKTHEISDKELELLKTKVREI